MTAQHTRLVRSFPGGKTIHRRGCPLAGHVVPWAWAEGRPDREWMCLPWLHACRRCFPTTERAMQSTSGAA